MKKRKFVVIGIAIICVIYFALTIGNSALVNFAVQKDAILVGEHIDVRRSWQEQLNSPVVSSFLNGYGMESDSIIEDSVIKTIIALTVGDRVVTSVAKDGGDYVLGAASPGGIRTPVLKFLLAIKYIPGLGKIKEDDKGVHYLDISPKKAPKSLFLSVGMRSNVLLIKLAKRPVSLEDMKNNSTVFSFSKSSSDMAHVFYFKKEYLSGLLNFEILTDGVIMVSKPGKEISVSASISPGKGLLWDYLPNGTIAGRNDIASALAVDHASLVVFFPSAWASKALISNYGFERGEKATDDAVLYFSTGDFGAKLYGFNIPSFTADIPGLTVTKGKLDFVLRGLGMPKIVRSLFTINGNTTICSSASSLEAQRHSQNVGQGRWREHLLSYKQNAPSAFLYFDVDEISGEAAQAIGLVGLLRSFKAIKMSESEVAVVNSIGKILPKVPTKTDLSMCVCIGDGSELYLMGTLQSKE